MWLWLRQESAAASWSGFRLCLTQQMQHLDLSLQADYFPMLTADCRKATGPPCDQLPGALQADTQAALVAVPRQEGDASNSMSHCYSSLSVCRLPWSPVSSRNSLWEEGGIRFHECLDGLQATSPDGYPPALWFHGAAAVRLFLTLLATDHLQADKLRDYKRRVQRERRRLLASIGIDADNPQALEALVAKLVGEEAEAGGPTKAGPADRRAL